MNIHNFLFLQFVIQSVSYKTIRTTDVTFITWIIKVHYIYVGGGNFQILNIFFKLEMTNWIIIAVCNEHFNDKCSKIYIIACKYSYTIQFYEKLKFNRFIWITEYNRLNANASNL